MIRFEQVSEPAGFDINARQPGLRWLQANPDADRPKDFWTPFKPQLADAFRQLCAYTVVYEPVGTVDHFISVNKNKSLAYEWGNYRFTLKRLHLQNDVRVIRVRQMWYQMYKDGKINIDGLRQVAPLIARAIEKQQESENL